MLYNKLIICCSAQKFDPYINYAHIKDFCLKSDNSKKSVFTCNKLFNMVSVLLEYIDIFNQTLTIMLSLDF